MNFQRFFDSWLWSLILLVVGVILFMFMVGSWFWGVILYFVFVLLGYPVWWLGKKWWARASLKNKYKIYHITQYVGFGSLTFWAFFNFFLPNILRGVVVYLAVFGIFTSIHIRKRLPRKNGATNLEEKIKNDLKINTRTYRKKFPKSLSWIGGLVIPGLPFFSILNKKWKKKLNQEALIHENVHIDYLQNGWLLYVIIFLTVASALTFFLFPFLEYVGLLVVLIYLIVAAVHFEYITFNKTNQYGNKLGIKTRKWNKDIAMKYVFVYTIQISIFFIIIIFIRLFISWLFG